LKFSAIGAIIAGMNDPRHAKVLAALEEAADEVNRRGTMLLPEIIKFVAEFLLDHPDPEVRAFLQQAERNHDPGLN